jgi:hypothetical protein
MGEKVSESSASQLAYQDNLSLFTVPASNLGVSDVRYLTHKPINQFNADGGIVKFHISGAGQSYLSLNEVYIKTVVSIVDADGKAIPEPPLVTNTIATAATADDDNDDDEECTVDKASDLPTEGPWSVSVVNYLAQSLWHQCEVRFNDVLVT